MNKLKELRKENNAQDKRLSKENDAIITDMICYLRASDLCEYDIEVIRKELTGMALEAQLRNEEFNDVIGGDHKAFCNELMKNGSKKSLYANVLETAYILVHGILALYLFEIIISTTIINIVKFGQFSMQITSGFVISTSLAVGIGFAVFYYITKNSFELSNKNRKIRVLFVIVFSAVWTIAVLLRLFMGETVLLTINCLYPIVFLALAYLIIKFLNDKYENSFFKA